MSNIDMSKWGPVTVLVMIVVSLACLVGAVVVIIQPATLSFQQYLDEVSKLIIGVGALGIGRGLHKGLAARPPSREPASAPVTRAPIGGHQNHVHIDPINLDPEAVARSLASRRVADSVISTPTDTDRADDDEPGGDSIDPAVAELIGNNPNEVVPDGKDSVHGS